VFIFWRGRNFLTHQRLIYADVNLVGESIQTINKTTEGLLIASKETGLEVNVEKTKHVLK
jgi:hypothetical protein